MRRRLLAIAWLCAAATVAGAQQPPAFRSGVQVVEVDVRVFDKDGRFVANLTRDDFDVLENGVPQELQSLYLVTAPGAEADAADAGLKPETGLKPDAGLKPRATIATPAGARQTWIFFFDLNHLVPGSGFDRARKAVEEFIANRFKDGDLAGVVAGSKMVNNRLTSVREELVNAVKSVKPLSELRSRQTEMTRDWPRLLDEFEVIQIATENREAINRAVTRALADGGGGSGVPPDLEVREKARRLSRDIQRMTMETLRAMNGLATGLAKIPGPKTIVFLSQGFVTQDMETTLRGVVGQAARAGGRVYAIDVRGLNRGASTSNLEQLAATDEAGPVNKFDVGEDGPNSLAVDTGGMMIRNENNIGRALETIARDSGRYYVIGYSPSNANFDGKYRPIEVRVKREGVRVRARRGYLALEPSKMLLPKPINTGPGADPSAGASNAKAADPAALPQPGTPASRPPGSPAPWPPGPLAATAAGTIVTTPSPPSSAPAMRMRPNAELTVKELAGTESGPAGDFAAKGWEAYQRGDVESAVRAFSEAAAQPDVRPWVLYALGLSHVALGRPAEAIGSWERVRRAAPEFEPVYVDLADTYLQVSDLTSALAVLRDAEKRWPKDQEIQNAIGVIQFRRGALDEAIATFTKATELAPEDALGYFNLARAYEMRFLRGQRYVSSQRRWVYPDEDRQKAEDNYQRSVKLGGPFAQQAAEGFSRLQWFKR